MQNPFEHLYRDSDVEGMTDGFDERTAYGSIEGFQDKSMGWSQFAQFYQHFNFNRYARTCVCNQKHTQCSGRADDGLAFLTCIDN